MTKNKGKPDLSFLSDYTPPTAEMIAEIKRKKCELAERIEAEIPGLKWDRDGEWIRFGGGAPWQGEGTLHGLRFYARLRYNNAAMTVYDEVDPESHDDYIEKEIMSCVIHDYFDPDTERAGNGYAGTLDDDEIIPFMQRLISELLPIDEDNKSHSTIFREQLDSMMKAMKVAEERKKTDGE